MCSTTLANRSRKLPNTINEESDENLGNRKPLVQTQFVPWACKHFAQPVMKEPDQNDVESAIHYEREWRYMRYDFYFVFEHPEVDSNFIWIRVRSVCSFCHFSANMY